MESGTNETTRFAKVKTYLSYTSGNSYSLLLALILLIIYEVITGLASHGYMEEYLGTDLFVSFFLKFIPFKTTIISVALVVILGYFYWKDRKAGRKLKIPFFLYMLLESLIYGVVLAALFMLISGEVTASQLGSSDKLSMMQKVGHAFGSGFYEELLFRAALVLGLGWGIRKITKKEDNWKIRSVVVLISTGVYVLAHLVIATGFSGWDVLNHFLFGLAMCGLIYMRRFGITAWTHAWYELIYLILS